MKRDTLKAILAALVFMVALMVAGTMEYNDEVARYETYKLR